MRLLAIMLLLTALPVTSQYGTRSVSGIVTDKRHNALPGAVVEIENDISLMIQSYITDKEGKYYFHGLSSDLDFTLHAKYKNHLSKNATLSKFNSDKNAMINLIIPID